MYRHCFMIAIHKMHFYRSVWLTMNLPHRRRHQQLSLTSISEPGKERHKESQSKLKTQQMKKDSCLSFVVNVSDQNEQISCSRRSFQLQDGHDPDWTQLSKLLAKTKQNKNKVLWYKMVYQHQNLLWVLPFKLCVFPGWLRSLRMSVQFQSNVWTHFLSVSKHLTLCIFHIIMTTKRFVMMLLHVSHWA